MDPSMLMIVHRANEIEMERRLRERALQAEARRRRRQAGGTDDNPLRLLLAPIRRLAVRPA